MPLAFRQFRISLDALPNEPRGVRVAGVALTLFVIALWGVVGNRVASAQSQVHVLYPQTPVAVLMKDARQYTVAQIVAGLPTGLRFEMLLERTGVIHDIQGSGPYTVLVPGNNYFDSILGGLPSYSRAEELALAERHVLSGVVAPGQDGMVQINGGFAIQGYWAQNGVVYVISRVLVSE